ncbi:CRAL-TRIO domain-containing protein [Plectosphaerella cucumerina]|uniref:CRAL-TRIO domain-containing protein n=1 Tax=Plectosphaerella cucumerina TaxID=40658 RepID=A0A8K0TH96_9PEZI|nr:CRAL-TRIO domain-containing protein [Plectosphaerella cucumerina]
MAAPQETLPWTPAPELDEKYDNYGKVFPTVVPISDPKDAEKGYAGHLSEMQKAQLFQLRSMLEAEGYTDRLDTLTMLRFLRARKFDVNLSKKMFIEFEEWRKATLLDHLVPTWDYKERDQIFQYYPQYYHKTDKDGRPVYVERLGQINLTAMRTITTDQRMLDNLAVEYEKCADSRLPACSKEAGHLVETFCTIMDLKNVSFGNAPAAIEYVKMASKISQNYYPERLGKLYIINASWAFTSIWYGIKGWLDPVTVKKIHILGGSYQKELLAQIPAENLPVEFGGKCQCEGAGCAKSDAGPWRDPKWKVDAWWEQQEAKDKAAAALAGTPKDPALQNKGGETAGAAGQETAAVSA